MLIARALGRPGVLVALGGVWDESAVRGLPISFRSPQAGRVVLGLQKARVRNPVMILDEIDKVGGATTNFGDPSAALLEVLDPAQNTHFRDAYIETPVDLSEVLFIATANDPAKIPAPLRDRLEIIEAPGYTDDEKVAIVRRTLWGEQLEVSGLSAGGFWTRTPTATRLEGPEGASGAAPARRRPAVEVLDGGKAAAPAAAPAANPSVPPPAGGVEVTDAAIRAVVRGHTCEAGVRQLARQLGAVCQFVACRRVETGAAVPVTVVAGGGGAAGLDPTRLHYSVAEILGPPRYDSLPDHVRDAVSRERDRVVGLIRRTPGPPPRRRGSRWWRNCRGGVRRSGPRRRRGCGGRSTVNTSAAPREKDRAIDYLVARQASADGGAGGAHAAAAGILCLCGPAGTGRTAFARALAAALGRRFARVSLAGVEKPAGILGVAGPAPDAGPGRLVDALRRLGPPPGHTGDNPLVVLGGLDRMGVGAADALLGALDPARRRRFRDRYVGLPLDLGGVLFVAVATDPGRIPPMLQDRLEALPLAGYTDAEKAANRDRASGPAPAPAARVVRR